MKILLLGKNGLLGRSFLKVFEEYPEFEIEATSHSDLDVSDFDALRNKILESRPDFLINTVALMVDYCEENPEEAMKVNAEAPGVMAEACKEIDAGLIQISTDYVFDGEDNVEYDENHEVNPINVYGETKLKAEELIMKKGEKYFIVRTSVLYGPNEGNFIAQIIKAESEGRQIFGVVDQVASPTYTLDLSEGIIEQFLKYEQKADIYHLTNSETCSRYELAEETFRILGKSVAIEAKKSEDLERPATRPKYSILKNTKLKPLRSWKEALKVYIESNFKK